jgi:DNA-directed RNA polymerase specialized sigma24 family protein
VPGELEEEVQLRLGSLVIGRDAALEHLRAVLGELRPDDRRVLCSFYGGGRETARTAAECGIAVSLVKVRLFRARQRLLRTLRRRLALAGEAEAAW